MAFQFPEVRKFLGLFAQANSFVLPDGAMEKANNIVFNTKMSQEKVGPVRNVASFEFD